MPSKKRGKKKITLKMPTQLELIKGVRGQPIPKGKVMKPKKGGKYKRAAEKRRLRRDLNK